VVPSHALTIRSARVVEKKNILAYFSNGNPVNVYQELDNWGRIHPTEEHWVSLNHIRKIDPVTTSDYLYKAKVWAWALYVRDKPDGAIVGGVFLNNPVCVYALSDGWARIGENKWVSAKWLITV